jgi:glutamate synthase (NADPH/NADH) small chain
MICPKCHQPLEGEEQYICCAVATLQWRCRGCAKVSEGFAFPYGACPQCGGKLEPLDSRPLEGESALEAVRIAFEIELGGRAFYAQAATETAEPRLRELFGRLAVMEQEHMETLERRYHALAQPLSPALAVERAALYAGIDNRPDDPGNLLRIAIACEERAADYFTERSSRAPDGSLEAQLYRELAAEEREHVALLTTEYEQWKRGKTGLL